METVQRILKLIKENNITASKLSEDGVLTSGLITQWKKGLQEPSAKNLVKLAEYFGCSVDYLLGRTDNPDVNK